MKSRKQLVNAIALNLNNAVSKKSINKVVDSFLEVITDELTSGNSVSIHNFGRFHVKTLKEKMYKNIKTKQYYIVPTHNTVRFKPFKELKDNV